MALLAKFAGELEPTRLMYIPSNCNSNREDSFSFQRFRSGADARTIGWMRLSDMLSARVSEG